MITAAWQPRQGQHLPVVLEPHQQDVRVYCQPHQQDPRKRWWSIYQVIPSERCPPTRGLGEHWGLTKPYRCGRSNRHAALSTISDYPSLKHVVLKNISIFFSPLSWLFLIVSCFSKMLTTLAVASWDLFHAQDNVRHLNCILSPWNEDTKSLARALPGTIDKGNTGMNA